MLISGTMLTFLAQYGIFALAGLVLASQLGIPLGMPAEVALLLAGSFAIHSVSALIAGLLLVAAADLVGSTALYAATRFGSSRLRLSRFVGTTASRALWRSKRSRLIPAIAVVRSLPLVRIYAAIGCGLARAELRSYVAGALPAALLWVGVPLTAGYVLRDDVRSVADHIGSMSVLIGLVPAVCALLFLLIRRSNGVRRSV